MTRFVQFPCCTQEGSERVGNTRRKRRKRTDQAWVGKTLVKLVVAERSRIAGPAEALEASLEVATDAVVADVCLQALVHVLGTGGASVTFRAGAPVQN